MKLFTQVIIYILFCIAGISASAQQAFSHIKNYQIYYGVATQAGNEYIILRRFENDKTDYLLLADPQTMDTKVDFASLYRSQYMPQQQMRDHFKRTPYEKALRKAEHNSVVIQDAGIEQGMPKQTGVSLTADLCPSHRALDRRIFTDMIAEFKTVEMPVPIALSVSGLWMLHHQQDLDWLKQLRDRKEIRITWVNHSYNHRVSATAPLKQNFLLEPGTDINYEVLATEQLMLKNGLRPSVFFRFPGLVSDQQLVYKITDFGLIPVGSDAWLAKGQQPQNGSIVLIHGNGNEPVGVTDFIKLLRSKTKQIARKQWLLYDLRESVDDEFSQQK